MHRSWHGLGIHDFQQENTATLFGVSCRDNTIRGAHLLLEKGKPWGFLQCGLRRLQGLHRFASKVLGDGGTKGAFRFFWGVMKCKVFRKKHKPYKLWDVVKVAMNKVWGTFEVKCFMVGHFVIGPRRIHVFLNERLYIYFLPPNIFTGILQKLGANNTNSLNPQRNHLPNHVKHQNNW